MERDIREFISYLHNTKKTSANTEVSYQRDLKKMAAYLSEHGIHSVSEIREVDLQGYLNEMKRNQFASSSRSRSVASVRAFRP